MEMTRISLAIEMDAPTMWVVCLAMGWAKPLESFSLTFFLGGWSNTVWLFSIAMSNCPFVDHLWRFACLSTKTVTFIAALNNQPIKNTCETLSSNDRQADLQLSRIQGAWSLSLRCIVGTLGTQEPTVHALLCKWLLVRISLCLASFKFFLRKIGRRRRINIISGSIASGIMIVSYIDGCRYFLDGGDDDDDGDDDCGESHDSDENDDNDYAGGGAGADGGADTGEN